MLITLSAENTNQITLPGLNYRRNIMLAEIKYTPLSKEKEDLEAPNTDKRKRNSIKPHQLH